MFQVTVTVSLSGLSVLTVTVFNLKFAQRGSFLAIAPLVVVYVGVAYVLHFSLECTILWRMTKIKIHSPGQVEKDKAELPSHSCSLEPEGS